MKRAVLLATMMLATLSTTATAEAHARSRDHARIGPRSTQPDQVIQWNRVRAVRAARRLSSRRSRPSSRTPCRRSVAVPACSRASPSASGRPRRSWRIAPATARTRRRRRSSRSPAPGSTSSPRRTSPRLCSPTGHRGGKPPRLAAPGDVVFRLVPGLEPLDFFAARRAADERSHVCDFIDAAVDALGDASHIREAAGPSAPPGRR
jgi:hypothetical protein